MEISDLIRSRNVGQLYLASEPVFTPPLGIIGKLNLNFFQGNYAAANTAAVATLLSGALCYLPFARHAMHSFDIDMCPRSPWEHECPSHVFNGTILQQVLHPFGSDNVFQEISEWDEDQVVTECARLAEAMVFGLLAIGIGGIAYKIISSQSLELEEAIMSHHYLNVRETGTNRYVLTIKYQGENFFCEEVKPYVYIARIGKVYMRIAGDDLDIDKHYLAPDYLKTRNTWRQIGRGAGMQVYQRSLYVDQKFEPVYETMINGKIHSRLGDGSPVAHIADRDRVVLLENHDWGSIRGDVAGRCRVSYCTDMNKLFTSGQFYEGCFFEFRTEEGYRVFNDGNFFNMAVREENGFVIGNYYVHPITGKEHIVYRNPRQPDPFGRASEEDLYVFTELYRNSVNQKRAISG
ncbi:MAG: hypothetical protein Q8K75_01830 [Chlamydiales bacterium]|nr:hypothetical protein [Chlamydiales bacterium]